MTTPEQKAVEEIKAAVESGVTDREFWHSRTPQERILAMELMRQRDYGYDRNLVPKFQYVIEFANLKDYSSQPERTQDSFYKRQDPS